MEVCMDKERKELLDVFKRLDPSNRADVLAHVRVAYAAQENTKKQYGIMGPDAPLFNGRGILKDEPSYALPGAGPVMGAQA
jgi:hypothetical protein